MDWMCVGVLLMVIGLFGGLGFWLGYVNGKIVERRDHLD
jgi:hypothetical protein